MAKPPNLAKPRLVRLSQAALLADVSTSALEYYIMIGLVRPIRPPGKRTRFFDARLIERIRLIRRLNRSGYTLGDIRQTWLRRR